MRESSVAECPVTRVAPGIVVMERTGSQTVLRRKSIPWARVIVDALLLLGFLAASSFVVWQR